MAGWRYKTIFKPGNIAVIQRHYYTKTICRKQDYHCFECGRGTFTVANESEGVEGGNFNGGGSVGSWRSCRIQIHHSNSSVGCSANTSVALLINHYSKNPHLEWLHYTVSVPTSHAP